MLEEYLRARRKCPAFVVNKVEFAVQPESLDAQQMEDAIGGFFRDGTFGHDSHSDATQDGFFNRFIASEFHRDADFGRRMLLAYVGAAGFAALSGL